MKQIVILIPSRDRNHKIERLYKLWFEYIDNSITTDCVIVLDEDNEHTYTRLPNFKYEVVKSNRQRGITFPINQAAKKYCDEYEYVGFWGDDHRPNTLNWNSIMYEKLNANKPYSMVYANDLLQGARIPTEVIMDSLYIQKLGYMVHPTIQHLYSDNYWMFLGKYMNNIHYLPDVVIEHEHYTCGKSEKDALYTELNSPNLYNADRIAYINITNCKLFKEKLKQLLKLKNI